jgi:hypothetical protein
MGAILQNPRARNRLVALAVAAALVAVYAFLAILREPLIADDEALNQAPGQATVNDPSMAEVIGTHGRDPLLLSYVDGGEATLVKALYNEGPTPITITGVSTFPSEWLGIVTLKDARAAAIVGPAPCCQINEAATWSAHDFRSFQINPGDRGVVAIHLFMGHCEDNSPGLYMTINSITVHYSVLGFPRAEDVVVGPYGFQSPESCPRTGPSRP